MLKRTVTYVDFDGVERTEDFYFNLTKAELMNLETSEEGGMSVIFDRLIKSPNGKEIMKYVNQILLASYGEKSSDGRRFMKSSEISKAFSETPAFDVIFMDLVTDAKKAADFVNAVMPDLSDLKKKVEQTNSTARVIGLSPNE